MGRGRHSTTWANWVLEGTQCTKSIGATFYFLYRTAPHRTAPHRTMASPSGAPPVHRRFYFFFKFCTGAVPVRQTLALITTSSSKTRYPLLPTMHRPSLSSPTLAQPTPFLTLPRKPTLLSSSLLERPSILPFLFNLFFVIFSFRFSWLPFSFSLFSFMLTSPPLLFLSASPLLKYN